MAKRRCISLDIIDSDAFMEMPSSSQNLYFHISCRCDDDGFCNCPIKVQRTVGASIDDLKLLIAKKFLLECPNGVVLVKHWWIHNLKRKDRYTPSNYLKDNRLFLDENNAYTTIETNRPYGIEWQPNGNQMATQDNISKDKLSKVNISKYNNNSIPSIPNVNSDNYETKLEDINLDNDLPFDL